MSLKSIHFTVIHNRRMEPSQAPLAIDTLFRRWMPERFVPCTLSGLWADVTMVRSPQPGGDWQSVPLWPGESATGGLLTSFSADPGALPPLEPGRYAFVCDGALFHHPPGNTAPEWYARICVPAAAGLPARLMTVASVQV